MHRPSVRATLLVLATLSLGSWALFGVDAARTGAPNLVLVATALMFTTMAAMLPFLTGWRVSGTHLVHAQVCRECTAPRWGPSAALGFCLRCGSTKVAPA